nr:DUF4192 family protein [Nocardia vinacea]
MPDNVDDAHSPTSNEATSNPGQSQQDREPAEPLRVDDPGELIVAVPAMVGFVPRRSLVVAVLRSAPDPEHSPIIDAVLRFDLDSDGGSRRGLVAAYAECVGQICAAEGATEVLAVIVDDRTRKPGRIRRQGTASAGQWSTLIAAFARRLAALDVYLQGAWAVRAIEAGQRWWSLLMRMIMGRCRIRPPR